MDMEEELKTESLIQIEQILPYLAKQRKGSNSDEISALSVDDIGW